MNKSLAIPTPPSTIKAPVVVLVESVALLRFTTPEVSNAASEAAPLAARLPET